jgi:hypothetical protein
MAMTDYLSRLLSRLTEAKPVDHIVKASLKKDKHVVASHTWQPLCLGKEATELRLKHSIDKAHLLLLFQL